MGGGLCQVPKIMYTISYAFNITLLIVIIVITTTERLFDCTCLLSRMLKNLRSCILLEGFTNFSVDPYYDPLSLVMIKLIPMLEQCDGCLPTRKLMSWCWICHNFEWLVYIFVVLIATREIFSVVWTSI